jgi:tetratricopeptide (TPR) repeat protein
LNDEFNRLRIPYHNKLTAKGSKIYLLDKTAEGGIPHHKFCIIDNETLITGSYNWSNNAKNNDENILIMVATEDDDYNVINEYSIQFQDLLYKYGVENEDEGWEEAIRYVNTAKEKQEDASFYYDLAVSYLKEEKLDDAIKSIDLGIEKLPYPDKNYYFIKHLILKKQNKFVDSTDYIYKYLSSIAVNDFGEIEGFKKAYNSFITSVKVNGIETYKVIADINQKTKSKLGEFAVRNLSPHFFNYEELDTRPF